MERLIEMAARIKELRGLIETHKREIAGFRSELAVLEKQFSGCVDEGALASLADPHAASHSPPRQRRRVGGQESLASRIESLFERSPGQRTAQTVCEELGVGASLPTVRSALARLVDEGVLKRVGDGLYAGSTPEEFLRQTLNNLRGMTEEARLRHEASEAEQHANRLFSEEEADKAAAG